MEKRAEKKGEKGRRRKKDTLLSAHLQQQPQPRARHSITCYLRCLRHPNRAHRLRRPAQSPRPVFARPLGRVFAPGPRPVFALGPRQAAAAPEILQW